MLRIGISEFNKHLDWKMAIVDSFRRERKCMNKILIF